MSAEPSPDETAPHGLAEGIFLVHRAQDSGEWKPVVDWLARNPHFAEPLVRFVRDEPEIIGAVNAPRPADRVGRFLGDYELLKELPKGMMGAVYEARDRLGRAAAVKVVCTAGMSPVELARVRFEVEALARLDHPNVVRLDRHGETGAELYFAMPLLRGTLDGRRKGAGGRLAAGEAARLVRDVARGVHHAHQRGLIHRDLKPANVLLDGDDNPLVADFGLARRADATLTAVAGSPAYMSPEQALGERHLTPKSDVHALGAILFELLTGRTPFAGGNAESVRRRVIEEPAPPPRALRPDVSRDLQAVCLKCLEKRPDNRYATALELADDLDRFLRREPVKARPRGLFADLAGALGWERESPSFVTWRGYAYGAANTVVNHAAVAALAFAGYPQAAFAVLLYHVFTWAAFLWWFAVRKRSQLSAVERSGLALHIGGILGIVLTLPLAILTRGPDIAGVYPVYNVVLGCMIFAHGATHQGRQYLFGLFWLSQNLLLPFLPVWVWPVVHSVVGGWFHIWTAVNLWRLDRAGRAESTAPPTV